MHIYIYVYICIFIHYKDLTVLHHRYIFWQPCHRYPSHQNIGETNGTTSHRFTHLCRRHDVMAQVVAAAKSWCQVVVYWIPMDQWIHNQWLCDILAIYISADPGRRKGERVREEDGRKGLAAASRHTCSSQQACEAAAAAALSKSNSNRTSNSNCSNNNNNKKKNNNNHNNHNNNNKQEQQQPQRQT